jgi:transposase
MRTIFSKEQIALLKQHPCVFGCSERSIHYTYEFKVRALKLHKEGISPKEIWIRAGFDPGIWKQNYTYSTVKDWERMVERNGLDSLTNLGGIQYDHGRTNKKDLIKVESDMLKRLELEVRYLKAENDFLAQLRAKRAESNSGRVKSTQSSEI